MRAHTVTYAELIRLPNVAALLGAIGLTRLADRMFATVIVFHALAAFGSPALAGWLSFAAIVPGLVISPLAGAFLDRSGAVRGIAIDLAASTALAGLLAAAIGLHQAGAPLLLALAIVYALTSPLSTAGVRVLLPRLVPGAALDRANALDTAIFAMVDVVAPSLAGMLVGFAGAAAAFGLIAAAFGAAGICVACLRRSGLPRDPGPRLASFLAQSWEGVMAVARRGVLRGLAAGYGLNLVTWGILVVAVPVVMARSFAAGTWEAAAGLLWAGAGVAGGIGALAAGQMRMLGREVTIMTACMGLTALAAWPLAGLFGVGGLACGLAVAGMLAGPIDVGVLTLRQRRTDPSQLGRVLAVSIAANTSGFPIGTALGGMLAGWWLPAAFAAAGLASLLAAAATWWLIPAEDRSPPPPGA